MQYISVVIPTRDRPEAVLNVVESVYAGDYNGPFDVFVIDQSKDGATRDALTAAFGNRSNFHYYLNKKTGVGAASSRNIGIASSSGEIVCVLDDDVTVNSNWMSEIAVEFAADPKLDFICGKLTAPPFDFNQGFTPSYDADPKIGKYQMPIAAAGANFSMRRSLLERVGGYDEFCGPGSRLGASDDGDLAWRVVRSGAKWKACPNVEVVHTFGFRKTENGSALLKRYQIGLGGNFGRFTRRGDVFAGLFFLGWQFNEFTRAIGMLLIGRKDTGLGWIVARLIGFARGFALDATQGFVSGKELARMRVDVPEASFAPAR